MFAIKKILCPTDFSEVSLVAVSRVEELARRTGAAVYLINVIPVQPVLPTDPNFGFNIPEYERHLHSEAEHGLRELAQPLHAQGIQTRTFIGHGDAADEIVRIAEQERVDLIVISTFGKTGWRRLAFGSVAEKVVRSAPCPVLTVRGVTKPELQRVA